MYIYNLFNIYFSKIDFCCTRIGSFAVSLTACFPNCCIRKYNPSTSQNKIIYMYIYIYIDDFLTRQ